MPDATTPAHGPGRPKDPAKRKAILAAAKRLFMRHGYEGSSMDAIAAEANVSKLTVYNHFSDKETLFAAAVKSRCEEQLPYPLFELDADTPIETTLITIGTAFFALVNSREAIDLHRVLAAGAAQDAKLSQLFFEAGPLRVLAEMERLLTRAVELGKLDLPDIHLAAEQFFTLIKGNCHFRLMIGCCDIPSAHEREHHVQQAVELFLRAYRPR